VYKGKLFVTERVSAAGHALRVLDEAGTVVKGASVWMGGQSYTANDRDEIVLPFVSADTSESVVICHVSLRTRQDGCLSLTLPLL
jgi:hypothetical protein